MSQVNDTVMTTLQALEIKSSWNKILQSKIDFVSHLYNRLVELNPESHLFFSTDVRRQQEQLVGHISLLVDCVHDWQKMQDALQKLSEENIDFNLKGIDLGTVAAALLSTLSSIQCAEWNHLKMEAWSTFYWDIVYRMRALAKREDRSNKHSIL